MQASQPASEFTHKDLTQVSADKLLRLPQTELQETLPSQPLDPASTSAFILEMTVLASSRCLKIRQVGVWERRVAIKMFMRQT